MCLCCVIIKEYYMIDQMERPAVHLHMKDKADVHLDILRRRVDRLEASSVERHTQQSTTGSDQLEDVQRKLESLEREVRETRIQEDSQRPQTRYANSAEAMPPTVVAASVTFPTTYQREENAILGKSTKSYARSDSNMTSLETKVGTYEGIVAVLNKELGNCINQIGELEHQRQTDREMLNSYEQKFRSLERSLALKDVALAEQDLRLQSLEATSYDGMLLWKIEEFSRKRQDAVTGKTPSIYSPVFYTSRNGQ